MEFERINDSILRLCVPFDNIYTSVFAVDAGGKWLLFDCGSDDYDVNSIIIPAVKRLGIIPEMIFVSHSHGDHAGGLDALVKEYPHACVKRFDDNSASDGESVLGCLKLLNLKGHSEDSGALLDERSGTLLSGDSLQLWGVGKYGIGVSDPHKYIASIDRLLRMNLKTVVASHDYYPLGFIAEGKAVLEYLEECRRDVVELLDFVKNNSYKEPGIISEEFGRTDPKRPSVPVWVLKRIIGA